jgi:uncharacterized protein (TIGR02231 family)
MKLLLLAFVFLVTATTLSQQSQVQYVKSEIKRVKLFLTSGEMLHEQTLQLKKGRNKIIFSGISAFADPRSIQLTGDASMRVVSVSTEMDFLAAEQFNPRIKLLNDSLEVLKDLHQANKDQTSSFEAELEVLTANRKLGGNNQNLTVAQIREAADFYRTRTLEINTKISRLAKDQAKLELKIENTRYQLVELNYNENQRSNQVVILIDVAETVTINTELKYLVSDCGWAAVYDLSAMDLNQKINLKYMAQVYNNTGNNWNDVELTLSTGDPKLSASFPELSPWYLNYYEATKMNKKNYYTPQVVNEDYRQLAQSNINDANQRVYDNYVLEKDAEKYEEKRNSFDPANKQQTKNPVSLKEIQISELMAEFPIQGRFSCPSDAKPYKVDIKEMSLDAMFTHVTVPKLDNGAFLLAHIVGWQDLELMPGPTNVYFGGAYVGVSEIDTRNISDTLSLSFGRDSKVTVFRKLKSEMSSKKVIGGSRKDSYLYEIAIRNNRSTPVVIDVFDQVPITRNSDISVTVDELSGVVQNEETGEANWKLSVQPGEVKTVQIGYTVKYPKDAKITIMSYRTVSCPAF